MTMVSGFARGELGRRGRDYGSIKTSCEPCVLKRRLCCSTAHTSLLGRLMSILGYDARIPCRRLADVVLGQLDILFMVGPVTSLTAGMCPSHASFDHRGITWAPALNYARPEFACSGTPLPPSSPTSGDATITPPPCHRFRLRR